MQSLRLIPTLPGLANNSATRFRVSMLVNILFWTATQNLARKCQGHRIKNLVISDI